MTARIPLLELDGFVIVQIQSEVHDELVQVLRDELLTRIEGEEVAGVLLDLSGLSVIDAYTAGAFESLARSTALLGTPIALVGIRPAVAATLVDLGIALKGVPTARTLRRAMERLR